MDEMTELSSSLSGLTAASDRAAVQLRRSLDAIERLKEMSKQAEVTGSAAKVRLFWAIRRNIVKNQSAAMRKRLARSPTYHALLAEQSAKGNSESAQILAELKASGSAP